MIEREDIVAGLIAAAPDKQLVGRVRLQKTAYLLEQLGLGQDLPFEYHHYGPYSRELDNAIGDAKAFGLIKEDFGHRQNDGAMFSIFRLVDNKFAIDEVYGALGRNEVSRLIKLFAQTNVTVLELAATIHWLSKQENLSDWRAEIIRRKGQKVQGGRLEKAINLLQFLNLALPC